MPLKCCVPACKSNYRGTPYVTCFKFPKDPDLRAKWLRKIPRDNFQPNDNSVVCVKHFSDHHVQLFDELPSDSGSVRVLRGKPKLIKEAYPSIFLNLPSYLSETPSTRNTLPEKRSKALDKSLEERFLADLEEVNKRYSITDFNKLIMLLNKESLCSDWIYIIYDNSVEFYLMDRTDSPPKISAFVQINNDLKHTMFLHGLEIESDTFKSFKFSNEKFSSWDELNNILMYIKNLSVQKSNRNENVLMKCIQQALKKYSDYEDISETEATYLNFLSEQLQLFYTPKNRLHYSPDTLVFAYSLFMKSYSVYEYVRSCGVLHLPHPQTLRNLSASFIRQSSSENDHLYFLKQKCSLLSNEEKLVNILIDEIHIQPSLQYKVGKVIGTSLNDNSSLAHSVHVTMLSSVLSKNKDVVSFLPARKLDAEKLYDHTRNCIKVIEDMGYKVLSVITDNNSINRKMFNLLLQNSPFPEPLAAHPFDNSRPLFLLFDSVHLLKCIRNNWIAQIGDFVIPAFPEKTEKTISSFHHLTHVYNMEKNLPIKYAYQLTEKALRPSSIEKQKVSLALKIFHRSNITALQHLCSQNSGLPQWKNWEGTVSFLSIIIDWWEIVNVKSYSKGYKKRNENMYPIYSFNSPQVNFLATFLSWLEEWSCTAVGKKNGGLSKETSHAFIHTIKTLVRLIKFLLDDCSMKFVLLGKFQTDKLEARFGQYRQLSGSNYHISLQQLYESEKKLKISGLLKLRSSKIGTVVPITELAAHFDHDLDPELLATDRAFIDSCIIDDIQLDFNQDEINNIAYVVGYACFKISQKSDCQKCIDIICTKVSMTVECDLTLISECDRGGLTYPTEVAVNAGLVAYGAFTKVVSEGMEQQFLNCSNQLAVFTEIATSLLQDDELIALCVCDFQCDCGSNLKDILKKIVLTCGNVFIKNYINSKFSHSKKSNKRKLAVFKKK